VRQVRVRLMLRTLRTQDTHVDLLHVLGIVGLLLNGIGTVMGIVYYVLMFSDRRREARKKQAE